MRLYDKDLENALIEAIQYGTITSKLDMFHYCAGYTLNHDISYQDVFKIIEKLTIKYELKRG